PTDAPGALYSVESMGVIRNAFFVKKDTTWRYTGIDSFKGLRFGVIAGYVYDDDGPIDKYIKNGSEPEVQVMNGDEALERNIQKLMAGRIDTLVEGDDVMAFNMKKLGVAADEIINAGAADVEKSLFIAFAPNKDSTKKYAQMWNEGIVKLRASGELKKILDRYSVKDWKQPEILK
ncbi:MAG: ABC transporter substrate-binding protein, partial [Candidatus Omnitrophica bacterium]|nr:ABC transporter substrate-binding protein [Candidatus Omnitrophota bacterium]